MTGVFLDPGDPRWTDFLQEVPHDVYHLPGYASLSSRFEGGKPVAFYLRDGDDAMLVPLLLRPIPHFSKNLGDLWDAASPYGYPAPLFSRPDRFDGCRKLFAAFSQALRRRGLVSLFMRLHPLLDCPRGILSQFGDLVKHGKTVTINLCLSQDELLRGTSNNHRRDLRKLARAGFQAVLDAWDDYRQFVHIYRRNMTRVGASQFYFFEGTYFDDLRQFLKDRIHLCSVISPTGELAAAGLFTVTDCIMEYHLGASRENYLELAPSKLLFDFMRRWGQEQGLRSFHLGGGLGSSNDSLFAFKAGFSSDHASFHTFRLVLDEAVYTTLCAARQMEPGRIKDIHGFFPLYREAVYNNRVQRQFFEEYANPAD